MIAKFKKLIYQRKGQFRNICTANKISLNYVLNKSEIGVLYGIFIDREYSDYFPFYQDVVIVDIGAHYGYFSLFASRNTSSNSKIIAIEPDANNYSALIKNINGNAIKNVSCINCAIGKEAGAAKLFKGENQTNSIIENYALLNTSKSSEVPLKTIVQIVKENKIDKIDFLKLDCEGAEYEILENAPPDFFQMTKTISMEFHDLKDSRCNGDFIYKILQANNFKIVKYKFERTMKGLNFGKIIGIKVL